MALNFSHKLDIRPAGQSRIIVTADNLPSVRSTIIIDPKGNAISVTETAAGTRTRHHPADKPILSDQLRLELAA